MIRFVLIHTLGLLMPCACLAEANPQSRWEATAGLSFMDFGYKEFGDQGELLDREDGAIPGVTLSIAQVHPGVALAGELSSYSGDVGYDGETNTGVSIATRTDTWILDVNARAEFGPSTPRPWNRAFYLGGGYHRWARDIRPTATGSGAAVRGLFEVYEWWRVLLGGYVALADSGNDRWVVDARVYRTVNPTVAVDFDGQYDNVKLDLGQAWGGRLAFPWTRRLSMQTGFILEPYLELWEHGRSADRSLTRNHVVVGTVHEPRSETRNVGVSMLFYGRF